MKLFSHANCKNNNKMAKKTSDKAAGGTRKKDANSSRSEMSAQSIAVTAVKPQPAPADFENALTETVLSCRIRPLASFTSLSAGAARMMAEHCKHQDEQWSSEFNLDGLRYIGGESAEALAKLPVRLSLNGLTELSTEVATALARHEASLHLDGIKSISSEVATALASHQGHSLSLNGVTSISADTAVGLSLYRGDLSLLGLRDLSHSVAKALASHKKKLDLSQVVHVEPGAMIELSKRKSEVRLSSIQDLEENDLLIIATAKHLSVNNEVREKSELHVKSSTMKTARISSGDLKKIRELIKAENAESISLAFGILDSVGEEGDWLQLFPKSRLKTLLSTWDTAIWRCLASGMREKPIMFSVLCEEAKTRLNSNSSDWTVHHRYKLFCDSLLDDVTDDLIALLSKAKNPLRFDKDSLSEETAKLLAGFGGELLLPNLRNFPDDSGHIALVEKLVQQDILAFEKLTSLSDAVAERLSQHQGPLDLSGLTSLSDAAAEALSKNKGLLKLDGVTSLSDAAAQSLSKHEGTLEVRGLTRLSDAAVQSLSKNQGDLYLDGLTRLSDAAVQSLSQHQGNLYLGGLTSLSDAAVQSLSQHHGYLYLGGLTSLSDAAAQSLSQHQGDLYLGSLTSLSDAAAQSLSQHQGKITLSPNFAERIKVPRY
jgi:hypothetical protein